MGGCLTNKNLLRLLDWNPLAGKTARGGASFAKGVFHQEYCTAVEPSEHMTQLGKYLTTDLEMPPIHWQRCLYDSVEEPLDLILVTYVQMEVGSGMAQKYFLFFFWLFLLVESCLFVFLLRLFLFLPILFFSPT